MELPDAGSGQSLPLPGPGFPLHKQPGGGRCVRGYDLTPSLPPRVPLKQPGQNAEDKARGWLRAGQASAALLGNTDLSLMTLSLAPARPGQSTHVSPGGSDADAAPH